MGGFTDPGPPRSGTSAARIPGGPVGLGTSAARLPFGRPSAAVRIPQLYCPEPVRIDEELGKEVNELLVSWVEKTGIFPGQLDHVRACNYGRYAMLIHPDTDDPERLLLAAQCMAALFAVDDHYCDDERTGSDPSLLGRRLAIAQAAIDPVYVLDEGYAAQLSAALRGDPVLAGLAAYMERVASLATPAQVDRVRFGTLPMFTAMNWEGLHAWLGGSHECYRSSGRYNIAST